MSNVAIIPARGGSKRIPDKNIKNFLGRPIIAYSIEAAINSGIFDEVMVSTDSEEIANIARSYGASVPFLRSAKTSDDFATIENVIEEVLKEYDKKGLTFDNFCCVFSTTPLLKAERLVESFSLFETSKYDSLFPVLRFSYPIQRALKLKNEKVVMAQPEHIHSRSQDLEPMFHDAGMFYWMKTGRFHETLEIFCDYSGMIELSEMEVQDIDNPIDWTIAEMKFKMNN
ncbi:pseudaminic acid cytidylyltransferase [Labilibaculum euxinus]